MRCGRSACPTCGKLRSRSWERLIAYNLKRWKWPALLTVTRRWRECADEEAVKDFVRETTRAFRELRRSGVGCMLRSGVWIVEVQRKASLEVAGHAGGCSWRVHIHAAVDTSWVNKERLSSKWRAVSGGDYIVDIRRLGKGALGAAAHYVACYMTKSRKCFQGRCRMVGRWGDVADPTGTPCPYCDEVISWVQLGKLLELPPDVPVLGPYILLDSS
jgi:hypothetical protein